ncbi:MAG TPA: hypothetical protein VI299_20905 [Polyangiales bacterium]
MAPRQDKNLDVREVVTERGRARLSSIAPGVYMTCTTGHMEEVHAELFESYGRDRIREAAGSKLTVFHDWFDMTGYDPRCRARLTSWSLANLEHYQEAHFGVRSKIVAMGVQVANMALRGFMCAHTSRARFDLETERVLIDKGIVSDRRRVAAVR